MRAILNTINSMGNSNENVWCTYPWAFKTVPISMSLYLEQQDRVLTAAKFIGAISAVSLPIAASLLGQTLATAADCLIWLAWGGRGACVVDRLGRKHKIKKTKYNHSKWQCTVLLSVTSEFTLNPCTSKWYHYITPELIKVVLHLLKIIP
jgi:hypothetical protein